MYEIKLVCEQNWSCCLSETTNGTARIVSGDKLGKILAYFTHFFGN